MRTLLLNIFLFVGLFATGQDLHFSQFYNSPLTINPALTGKKDVAYRANINYRNQWFSLENSKPFSTFAASIDGRPIKDVFAQYDNLGVGLQLYHDRAGDGGYTDAQVLPSVSYHKALGYNHKLAVGIQSGLGTKRIDFSSLVVEQQYVGTGFDQTLPWGETLGEESFSHLELGVGTYYSYRDNTDKWNGFLGGSLLHVNEPNTTFLNESYTLKRRAVLNGGLTYFSDNGLVITPSVLYMKQAGASQMTFGLLVGSDLTDKYSTKYGGQTAVYAGAFWRKDDAIIGKAGVQFDDIQVGISGDFAASDINKALGIGSAFELSITFIGLPDKDAKPIFCPGF